MEIILRARSPKSLFLLEALRENLFHVFLAGFGGCHQSLVVFGLQLSLPPLSHGYVSAATFSSLCKNTNYFIKAHSSPPWLHNTWLHLQRPYFQVRSHSEEPNIRIQRIFWGYTIQSTTVMLRGFKLVLFWYMFTNVIISNIINHH